jgi:phosphinothricin acetyltransferase
MQLVDCTLARHGETILEILNDAIVSSTALYDYVPRPPEAMVAWFEAKKAGRYPVLGFEDERGRLLGFASYGTFRAFPAYKYTVEHSVYVQREERGRGLGPALLRALIERAKEQQYHAMVAAIDVTNAPSIRLHQKLGFEHAGTLREVGFKFGRWLDLAFYKLTLPTPEAPEDG